jgi:hypothetical protein
LNSGMMSRKSKLIAFNKIANEDAVPYHCWDSNKPRVEVPNLIDLKHVLSQERKTATGIAIDPFLF